MTIRIQPVDVQLTEGLSGGLHIGDDTNHCAGKNGTHVRTFTRPSVVDDDWSPALAEIMAALHFQLAAELLVSTLDLVDQDRLCRRCSTRYRR